VPATGYPPPDHILRDLDIHTRVSSDTTACARIPASEHVLGADGGVRAGVLSVLVDLAGGAASVRPLHPDWMATADLTVQLGAPARGPWVEARATVLRRGRTTLVVEAGLYNVEGPADDEPDPAGVETTYGGEPDGTAEVAGEQVGVGTLTMAVLPARPGAASLLPEDDSLPVQWAFDGRGLDRPVADALSVRVVDRPSGRLTMPVVPYVHNSFGAAQGGVMGLLAELSGLAAVESAADGRAGGSKVSAVTDLQIAYLTLGRVGPITSRAEVIEASADGGGRAVVQLADEGAADRVTTVVNVVAVAVSQPTGRAA
jgi:uncharacterized protein (TIGR00369 family)